MGSNTIDYIILGLFLIYFLDGFRRGLFRSLIGPLSLVFCGIIGAINYDVNGNVIKSLLIAIIGSSVLTIIINIAMFFARRNADKSFRNSSFMVSRLLGGFVSLAWKGGLTILTLSVVSLLPGGFPWVAGIQTKLNGSIAYRWIEAAMLRRAEPAEKILQSLSTLTKPEELRKLEGTKEYQAFFADAEVRKILQDERIQQYVKNNDLAKLMTDPNIQALINNASAMDKLTNLSHLIYEQQKQKSAPPAATPAP